MVEDSRETRTRDETSVGELDVFRDKIPLGADVFMRCNIEKMCKNTTK